MIPNFSQAHVAARYRTAAASNRTMSQKAPGSALISSCPRSIC
jgi:hypothetical protein